MCIVIARIVHFPVQFFQATTALSSLDQGYVDAGSRFGMNRMIKKMVMCVVCDQERRHTEPLCYLSNNAFLGVISQAAIMLSSMDQGNVDAASRFGMNPMMNMMGGMGGMGMPGMGGMPGQEPPGEKTLDPVLKPEMIRAQLNAAAYVFHYFFDWCMYVLSLKPFEIRT